MNEWVWLFLSADETISANGFSNNSGNAGAMGGTIRLHAKEVRGLIIIENFSIESRKLSGIASVFFYFVLWLVWKTRVTLSFSQVKN